MYALTRLLFDLVVNCQLSLPRRKTKGIKKKNHVKDDCSSEKKEKRNKGKIIQKKKKKKFSVASTILRIEAAFPSLALSRTWQWMKNQNVPGMTPPIWIPGESNILTTAPLCPIIHYLMPQPTSAEFFTIIWSGTSTAKSWNFHPTTYQPQPYMINGDR